ncbi:MAG: hydantoinase/oxoprolinase family protein [Chloroflexi bacterium]|nr:MAG: hydantoinase/oxoprolinase family protein [Chloroflexota bacterium]
MTQNNPPLTTTNLVLGIDTGGTYTDGVLLEYETRRVLATHKSLTTKRDFSIGIEQVIDGIRIDDPSAIKMVSISTTLATNAIAEGKGKRVALFLLGYDPDLVSAFKMEHRFATPHFYYFAGGHDLYGQEKEPLDLPAILQKTSEIQNQVDAIAVSGYFSPLNPEHENRAREAISRICSLPVVLGHQLSTRLGSIERATTAALNASLLAVLQDFVIAVRRAMERRNIIAPLMVVRGDGTLMSDEFAALSPVETIHSGPAASAMGGRFLSGLDDMLVVDVGGTTTDLALVQNGQVTVSEEGATVGSYKTAVKAANLLSIALGGDSHITLNRENELVIGPERVTPLAYLAHEYPYVNAQLRSLSKRSWMNTGQDWLEYWFLLRQPQNDSLLKTNRQKQLVALLQDGPKPLPDILRQLNVFHASQLEAGELFRQEILARAGLTPTDLIHVEGGYTPWDVDAANFALQTFSRVCRSTPDDIRQQVWRLVTETVIRAIVSFLTNKPLPRTPPGQAESLGDWFFTNSLYDLHPQLETRFRLRYPIVGIGAPAEFFLREAARLLHTDLILPEHYQVANAVGAVAGSVMVTEEILVYPRLSGEGLDVVGYYVQASDERLEFEEAEYALAYARTLGKDRALGAAIRSGADNPQVTVEEILDGLDTYRIRAKAMGNPRLAK